MFMILAVVSNVGTLLIFSYSLAQYGLPGRNEWIFFWSMLIAPLFTLLYFYMRYKGNSGGGSVGELVGLEIEARKSELRRRIEGDRDPPIAS